MRTLPRLRTSDLLFLIPIGLIIAAGSALVAERGSQQASRSASTNTSAHELVMIFIGGSNCAYSMDESLPSILAVARTSLEAKARERGFRFVTVGVAINQAPDAGLAYLARMGAFDELMVGRSWLNTGVIKYVLRDIPGYDGIPQVVVVQREVEFEGPHVRVGEEQLLARKAGLPELAQWSTLGAPIRSFGSTPSATVTSTEVREQRDPSRSP